MSHTICAGYLVSSHYSNVTHNSHNMCRVFGIQKYPFGTTSVRTAPLIKKDELHMPGPAHYQETAEENTPQEGRATKAKSTPKLSHTFASTTKRLYSPPSIVTVSCSKCCTRAIHISLVPRLIAQAFIPTFHTASDKSLEISLGTRLIHIARNEMCIVHATAGIELIQQKALPSDSLGPPTPHPQERLENSLQRY